MSQLWVQPHSHSLHCSHLVHALIEMDRVYWNGAGGWHQLWADIRKPAVDCWSNREACEPAGVCARACDAGYQQQLSVSMRQINPVQCTDQKFISSRVALCVWIHNAYVWWRILRRYLRLRVMCVAFPSSGLVQAMSEMILRGLSETPGLSLSTQPTLG